MIALIPAKGTSERIPRKNMALLGGRPLLDWTIEAAITSGVFDEICLSTEDDEIMAHARKQGINVVRRPTRLSEPTATIEDVIVETRRALTRRGPIYVLVPTSPFRSVESIRAVANLARNNPDWSILSVRISDHPWTALRLDSSPGKESLFAMNGINRWRLPRCRRADVFIHDGAHWIIQGEHRWRPFHTPEDEILDINTPRDLAFAEFLLQTGRVPWLTPAKTSR